VIASGRLTAALEAPILFMPCQAPGEDRVMTQSPAVRFSAEERALLLALKGVGPTVLERLEALGIASMDSLAVQNADDVCRRVAAMLGASCWSNSPMARAAIANAIAAANGNGRGKS